MTKKDFEKVAEIVGYLLAYRETPRANSELVHGVCNMLRDTNPRFKDLIFTNAVLDAKGNFEDGIEKD